MIRYNIVLNDTVTPGIIIPTVGPIGDELLAVRVITNVKINAAKETNIVISPTKIDMLPNDRQNRAYFLDNLSRNLLKRFVRIIRISGPSVTPYFSSSFK
jgi:hypothetical protein